VVSCGTAVEDVGAGLVVVVELETGRGGLREES